MLAPVIGGGDDRGLGGRGRSPRRDPPRLRSRRQNAPQPYRVWVGGGCLVSGRRGEKGRGKKLARLPRRQDASVGLSTGDG